MQRPAKGYNPFKRSPIKQVHRQKLSKRKLLQAKLILQTKLIRPIFVLTKKKYLIITVITLCILIFGATTGVLIYYIVARNNPATMAYEPYPSNMTYPIRSKEQLEAIKEVQREVSVKKEEDVEDEAEEKVKEKIKEEEEEEEKVDEKVEEDVVVEDDDEVDEEEKMAVIEKEKRD